MRRVASTLYSERAPRTTSTTDLKVDIPASAPESSHSGTASGNAATEIESPPRDSDCQISSVMNGMNG